MFKSFTVFILAVDVNKLIFKSVFISPKMNYIINTLIGVNIKMFFMDSSSDTRHRTDKNTQKLKTR